ncbi:MAG: transglycosylase SLT domain-containing protein [Bacteroidota bacterium]
MLLLHKYTLLKLFKKPKFTVILIYALFIIPILLQQGIQAQQVNGQSGSTKTGSDTSLNYTLPDSIELRVSADSLNLLLVIQLVEDDPFVAKLESLLTLKYFENSCFITDTSVLNVYNFAPDSVPVYDSSVYESRLAYLNEQTPFSLIYNEVIKRFIELYAVKRREQVSRMMGLAELYFPIFEEALDLYGLPLELKYLAVIESALNANARSRAGAMGLWQFMYKTGKLYDLKITSYVDERLDPYKSTYAACEYLRFLYSIYDDWNLALAAYNSGPGRVNRAIRRSGGKTNYWELWPYLPRETRGYLPAFIAVNYIMEYATEHNLYPIAPKYLHYETDTVKVNRQVSFKQISAVLDIPIDDVEFLNPVYKKGIIPGISGELYTLYLPAYKIGDFINNEQAIYNYKSPEEKRDSAEAESSRIAIQQEKIIKENMITHAVKEGEVLGLIAERYKCSIKDIKDWNYISGTNIYAGKKLVIYTNADPSAFKKEQKTLTANKVPDKETVNSGSSTKYIHHIVQPGDTLWDIAQLYEGVTVRHLKKINNISNVKKLKPGMKIKIAVAS